MQSSHFVRYLNYSNLLLFRFSIDNFCHILELPCFIKPHINTDEQLNLKSSLKKKNLNFFLTKCYKKLSIIKMYYVRHFFYLLRGKRGHPRTLQSIPFFHFKRICSCLHVCSNGVLSVHILKKEFGIICVLKLNCRIE